MFEDRQMGNIPPRSLCDKPYNRLHTIYQQSNLTY